MTRNVRNQRGIAVLVVLTAMALLFVVVVSMGLASVQNLGDAAHSVYEKQAYYTAAAGVQDALAMLQANRSWSAGYASKPLPNHTELTYTVVVTNNLSGSAAITAPDGTSVPPGAVYLHADGSAPETASRTVSAMMATTSLFDDAVAVQNQLSLDDHAAIDAWNSAQGPYFDNRGDHHGDHGDFWNFDEHGDGHWWGGNDAWGYREGDHYGDWWSHDDGEGDHWQGNESRNSSRRADGANVATNSTQPGAVSLEDHTAIYGSITVGPNGDPGTVVANRGANYVGPVGVASSAHAMPILTFPAGTGPNVRVAASQSLSPGTYQNLTLDSRARLTLTGGTYYFTGNVSLGGHSRVIIDATRGPVIIYVGGNWSADDRSAVNPNGFPANLQVYGVGPTSSLTAGNHSLMYAATYFPNGTVSLANHAQIFGAVVANSVDMRNHAQVHYDQALRNAPVLAGTLKLTAYHRW